MAGSKPKGIPSWQTKSTTTLSNDPIPSSAQNDDPVYSQVPATATNSDDTTLQSDSDTSSTVQNDDPVYAQSTAAPVSTSESTESASINTEIKQSGDASSSISSDPDPHLRSRSSLVASASKFLQHEDLHKASLEQKIAFLEEKGLTRKEIDSLLDTQPAETTKTIHESSTSSPPPIITYPEFLLHAHRPKPVMTRTRIINAVYATGLISGTLYLASRYLFEPMAEQMALARHELFESAQKGVEDLNQRLEKNVSVIPTAKGGLKDDEDQASVASDPEELFHRDVGVQTSPKLEEDAKDSIQNANNNGAAENHASKLQELRRQMQTLLETGKDALEEEEIARSTVGDLQAYLEELTHGGRKPTFSWENGFNAENPSKKGADAKDEMAKFKAEIRSVKGALLSAKNFPSSSVRVR